MDRSAIDASLKDIFLTVLAERRRPVKTTRRPARSKMPSIVVNGNGTVTVYVGSVNASPQTTKPGDD